MSPEKRLLNHIRGLYKPPSEMLPHEWVEDSIYLSDKIGPYPGPFSFSHTPYLKNIVDNAKNPYINRVVLCFGAQTGKTTALTLMGSYWAVNKPGPTMWVFGTHSQATSFSKKRWQPILTDSHGVNHIVPSDYRKMREDSQDLETCDVYFTGSNSPTELSSKSVRYLICDEIDKYPTESKKEAGALKLAQKRTRSFSDSVELYSSTPTTTEGEIWQMFLEGSQSYYYVPSPHKKDHKFKLEWNQVKWSQDAKDADGQWDLEEVIESSYLECPFTGKKILDKHKPWMLENGEWRCENDNPLPGTMSYHLNSLYSLSAQCTFGRLAADFIKQKVSIRGTRDFVNSTLGLPWDPSQDAENVKLPQGDYVMGIKEVQGLVRMLTVDVQKDHFFAVVRDWSLQGESRLIACEQVSTWEDLLELQAIYKVRSQDCFIDTGYRTQEVYRFCHHNKWYGVKGMKKDHFIHKFKTKEFKLCFSSANYVDAYLGDKQGRRGTAIWFGMANNAVKDTLDMLIKGDMGHWQVPSDCPLEYEIQLNAEKKKPRVNARTGVTEWEWVVVNKGRNHFFDCECMQVMAASLKRLI